MLYLKLVLIGFGIVGGIGFIIYFVAAILELIAGVSNPNPSSGAAILFSMLHGVI